MLVSDDFYCDSISSGWSVSDSPSTYPLANPKVSLINSNEIFNPSLINSIL